MKDIQFTVADKGAELVSIQRDGREYLWNGDPKFWGRSAPILFPAVGMLANDKLRIDGHEYTMKQHGFARDTMFIRQDGYKPAILGGNTDVLTLRGPLVLKMCQDGIPANYPYSFDLEARYETIDNSVSCSWTVRNIDSKTMYFQIGAHPAFLLPDYDETEDVHGYVKFFDESNSPVSPMLTSYLIDGLRHTYATPRALMNGTGICPITNSSFVNGALMIEGNQVASIALLDKQKKEVLRVVCPQAECYGLWAPNKPGCPFVCIEPWCGIADKYDFQGEISEREYIHSLEPDECYVFNYMIQIS